MPQPYHGLDDRTVIVGLDFSTGAVKGLAFDLTGQLIAEARLPTDLWTTDGVSELNVFQLEGQARAIVRALASRLREQNRLGDWAAIGISATHHTASRIDAENNPIRRAICWNDHSLAEFHARGLARLGGMERAMELIGGPWAIRYTLSHLVKDETPLSADAWRQTKWILPHGPLAAGYLTGRFDAISVSSAASTGIMDLRTNQWQPAMLEALAEPEYRRLTGSQLPPIVEAAAPLSPLADHVAVEVGIRNDQRPMVFPTSDDQQAGLIGGGAVVPGEIAIILGNSAVVNSSADQLPRSGTLDAMKLNWGPFLWMRCFNNGAQFLDRVVGPRPDWSALENAARKVPPRCEGVSVSPFIHPEPSEGIREPQFVWSPHEPTEPGVRFRAALEALADLVVHGVREHEAAGQTVRRIVLSGGIAQSDLMGEILATMLDRTIERLQSSEGPALGAAVTALWGLESTHRRQRGMQEPFAIANAAAQMVRYRPAVSPRSDWRSAYTKSITGGREP